MSSEIVFQEGKYVLEGEVTVERVQQLQDHGVKSVLYLCKDNGTTDFSFPEGAAGFRKAFGSEEAVAHVPYDSALPEYQVSAPLPVPWQKILAYRKYEEALATLPAPAAIICKTSRRASAVYAAYKAVTQHLTKEQMHEYAVKHGKPPPPSSLLNTNFLNCEIRFVIFEDGRWDEMGR